MVGGKIAALQTFKFSYQSDCPSAHLWRELL